MKTYYQNTCLGCDLLHSKQCSHYPKNHYPGHARNVSSPFLHKPQLYTHQYVELRNGIYEGTMSNFKRDGLGIFFSDEGFLCIGNWLQDVLEGKCIIFFCNGGYLYVNFTNNKINGLGILKMKNGTLIAGVWRNNNLEGTAFHHYPEKCLWIECEYREGQLVGYAREERYGGDLEVLMVKGEKIPEVRLPKMLNANPELKSLILSVYTNNFIQNIIQEMNINVRSQFSEYKMITNLSIKKNTNYLGYTENDKSNGLGVFYDDQFNVWLCGNFKGGFLEGIGRINYDNGDVYEGLIRKEKYQVGIYYNFEKDSFEFANYQNSKIFQNGNGFPFELLKMFKTILHKKHIKFQDKCFELTKNLRNGGVDEISIEKDEIKLFNDKLKKIELSPASFLIDEQNLQKNPYYFDKDQCPEMGLMFSPIPKKEDSKSRYNNPDNIFESSQKSSKTIRILQSPNIYPLNISQYPLKEEKYQRNFDNFYDEMTVASKNNAIREPGLKFSQIQTHLDKESVFLPKPAKKMITLNRKNDVLSGTFIYEEQNNNNNNNSRNYPKNSNNVYSNFPNAKMSNHVEKPNLHNEKYGKYLEKQFEKKNNNFPERTYPQNEYNDNNDKIHKRSVSLAALLKKDSDIDSSYQINLDDKAFQSIPKTDDILKTTRKYYQINEKQVLCKSFHHDNENHGKRRYLVCSYDDPNHLKNKKEQLVDCLVYDFDRDDRIVREMERDSRGIREMDSNKKNRKKIFDPM